MAKHPVLQGDNTIEFHGHRQSMKMGRSTPRNNSEPLHSTKSCISSSSFGGGSCSKGTRCTHPVIIHTFEPEVVIIEPGEFMRVVQRLTGSWNTRRFLRSAKYKSRKLAVPLQGSFAPMQPGKAMISADEEDLPGDPSSSPSSPSRNPVSCNISNPPDNTVSSRVSPLLSNSSDNYDSTTLAYYNVKPIFPSAPPLVSDLISSKAGSKDMSTGCSSTAGDSSDVEEGQLAYMEAADEEEEGNFFLFSLDSYYGTRAAQDDDWQQH